MDGILGLAAVTEERRQRVQQPTCVLPVDQGEGVRLAASEGGHEVGRSREVVRSHAGNRTPVGAGTLPGRAGARRAAAGLIY